MATGSHLLVRSSKRHWTSQNDPSVKPGYLSSVLDGAQAILVHYHILRLEDAPARSPASVFAACRNMCAILS